MTFSLDFPHLQEAPASSAVFRSSVQDFRVIEELGFEPSGAGDHSLLHVRKRGENTQWLAERIADFASVDKRDVGFCGLKDRWAETSQWFSVYKPKGDEPDWTAFAAETEADIDLLAASRHHQKLRRGMHVRNRFIIRLTELQAAEDLPERLNAVSQGVPNYFGEQRFGREGNNLNKAAEWLEQGKRIKARNLRGLVTSAARSWLFNQVLAHRVKMGNWNHTVSGDVLTDEHLPTGPLWGRGRSPAQDEAAALEQAALAPWEQWTHGLEYCGLNQERRPLVLMPQGFEWQLEEGVLTVAFGLPPGQFATAVLREIANVQTPFSAGAGEP